MKARTPISKPTALLRKRALQRQLRRVYRMGWECGNLPPPNGMMDDVPDWIRRRSLLWASWNEGYCDGGEKYLKTPA